MRKKSAKKAATIGDSEQFTVPAAAGDLAARQDLTPASGSTSIEVTKTKPEPQQELPPNRAAFLLGFYVQLPAPDLVFEPLVALCDGLPVTKVMLLDNCLARILTAQTEEHFHGYASCGGSATSQAVTSSSRWLYLVEIEKLQTIAANFWSGRSELRHWYGAGNSVGALMALLVQGKTKEQSEQDFIEEIGRQLDATGEAIRLAAKWSYEAAVSSTICAGFHRIRERFPADEKGFKLKSSMCKYVEQLAVSISNVPSRIPALTNRLKEEQAEFVYEQMTIHKNFGTDLFDLVKQERERRAWPIINHADTLREIADKHALDHGLLRPPRRSPGRKPDNEE